VRIATTVGDKFISSRANVSATGKWCITSLSRYPDDPGFAAGVAEFLVAEGAASTLDVGSGSGAIAEVVAARGIRVLGVDGNPRSVLDSRAFENGGRADFRSIDLSEPFPLELGSFDWVMSFAVAEHVPFNFEHIFVTNLQSTARAGILLVWDERSATGTGHVNSRDELEVLRIFNALGFDVDVPATDELRGIASLRWYKLVLVLRRRQESGHVPAIGLPFNSGTNRCHQGLDAMLACVEEHRARLLEVAQVMRDEHELACWPPAWQDMRDVCCRDMYSKGQSCYGTGFDHRACCATVNDYRLPVAPL